MAAPAAAEEEKIEIEETPLAAAAEEEKIVIEEATPAAVEEEKINKVDEEFAEDRNRRLAMEMKCKMQGASAVKETK